MNAKKAKKRRNATIPTKSKFARLAMIAKNAKKATNAK